MGHSHWQLQDQICAGQNQPQVIQSLLRPALATLPLQQSEPPLFNINRDSKMPTSTAATLSWPCISTTKNTTTSTKAATQLSLPFQRINLAWSKVMTGYKAPRMAMHAQPPSTPDIISEKVKESIKAAEETCAEDATSGECVAAWDVVEELSAAASHARDRLKNSDPLEDYCKDNPETEECRTYED